VLSIILVVLLTFFTPTLIEDASFSRYDYLHDFRRTSQARDDDHPNDGWQKDGTFNPIHVIQETAPDGTKRIIKEDGYSYDRYNRLDNRLYRDTDSYNRTHNRINKESKPKKKTENKTDDSEINLLPILLIILLLLVIVIVAVKYNYHDSNKNVMNRST